MRRTGASWERLERYARWRGRMRLIELPCDLLHGMVKQYLLPHDVLCLGEAFADEPLDWSDAGAFVRALPLWLRLLWMRALGTWRAHQLVREIESEALWYAMRVGALRLHLDWSPFAARSPCAPLALIEWRHSDRCANTLVDTAVASRATARVLSRRCANVQASLIAASQSALSPTRLAAATMPSSCSSVASSCPARAPPPLASTHSVRDRVMRTTPGGQVRTSRSVGSKSTGSSRFPTDAASANSRRQLESGASTLVQ